MWHRLLKAGTCATNGKTDNHGSEHPHLNFRSIDSCLESQKRHTVKRPASSFTSLDGPGRKLFLVAVGRPAVVVAATRNGRTVQQARELG